MIGPEERMQAVLVSLLEKGDELPCLSLHIRPHPRHVQGQLTRHLKVAAQEVIEDLHVGFLLEENVIGQVLKNLTGKEAKIKLTTTK